MIEKVNLSEKFSHFNEYWNPKVVGELNGQQVRLAKLKGEFVWHHHADEDELFLVIEGRLCLELRDGAIWLEEGELAIVPRGVEHRPVAPDEARILLFEPKGTLNTGNVRDERSVPDPESV